MNRARARRPLVPACRPVHCWTVSEVQGIGSVSATEPGARAPATDRATGGRPLFSAPGEMAQRCREFDWASTPLGPVEHWSRSLCALADAVLASRNPMLLFWGPELVQFYNDAFRPSLGSADGPSARHPRALGMRAADFWTDVWSVVGPQIEGVMQRGEAVWFEDLHLPIERNGRLDDAWWTYSYSPVRDDDGRINGTLVVCIETTSAVNARRELIAERARAEGILESMADAYLAFDAGFRFVAANRAALTGVDLPLERLLGRTLWELFPGTIGNEWESTYRHVMERRGEAHILLPYHDERLDLIVEGDIYATPDGGIVAFWRDVTQREKAAHERERLLAAAEDARRSAENANRAKADFLAIMSHELRTPLNAIGGYADLIEMGVHGPVTAQQLDALEKLKRSQRHLLGLINGVLNYVRIDAGSVDYDVETFELGDVLATCEALTGPQLRDRGLACAMECDAGARVRADREKVQQVILNLVGNAMKFTDRGGRVTVRCRVEDARVLIDVADTGRGIPHDRLEGIFQPFVQIDPKLTRAHEGLGLGLAISRDLARGMGGDVTVTSTPGEGSTFTMSLPRG
jgi:signal transduction histidine kinase